jgi:tetratricopeptide (TPR) repeat protein
MLADVYVSEWNYLSMYKLTDLLWGVLLLSLGAGCASLPQSADPFAMPVVATNQVKPEVADRAELLYQLMAGEIAGKRGNIDAATEHYLKASELSSDPQIASRTARIALAAKNYELALGAVNRWLVLEPKSAEAQQTAGVLLVRMDKPQESAEHFISVIDLTEDPEIHFAQLNLLLGRGEVTASELEVMASLRRHYNEDVHAQRAYADLAYRGKHYKEADAALNDALRIAPNDRASRILQNRILLDTGKVDEGLQGMQALLKASPKDVDLRHDYARMLVKARRYDKALIEYQQVMIAEPEDLDLLYSKALLEIELKHYDDARVSLKQLRQSPHHRDEAVYYLGRVEEDQKAYEEAIDWYTKVREGEYYFEAQSRVADMLAKIGRLEEAREFLARARNQIDNEALLIRLYLSEGQLLREAGAYQESYDFYNQTLKKFPDNTDLVYARAMTAEELGHLDWLERDMHWILEREPDNATTLNALGYTLADTTDRHEEALGYITKALALRPDDPAILDSMGWVNYRLGNFDKAEHYLRKALSSLEDAEISSHLGEVLWARGEHEDAKKTVRSALESAPEDTRLLELKKQFEK